MVVDVTYTDVCKALDMGPMMSLSLNWKEMYLMVDCSVGMKLVGWSHPGGHSQHLRVPMEMSDKGCPSGYTGTSVIK